MTKTALVALPLLLGSLLIAVPAAATAAPADPQLRPARLDLRTDHGVFPRPQPRDAPGGQRLGWHALLSRATGGTADLAVNDVEDGH